MNSRHSSHRALVEELWRFSCRVRRGARCLAPTATEPSSDSRCEGEHPRSGAVRSPHQPRECSAAAATRFAVRLLTDWRNLTTGPAVSRLFLWARPPRAYRPDRALRRWRPRGDVWHFPSSNQRARRILRDEWCLLRDKSWFYEVAISLTGDAGVVQYYLQLPNCRCRDGSLR